MKISEPGIYNIKEEAYHADPCILPSLSSTGAKKIISHSPYHYDYDQQHGQKNTKALKFGSAAHINLLEPERFKTEYHVTPEGFSRAHHKKWADELAELEAAEQLGRTELSFKDHETIQGFSLGMSRQEDILKKFMASPKEQSAFWFDEIFRIWRRARFDFFPVDGGRIWGDYKTMAPMKGSMTDGAIARHMFDYGWYQQAAWYLDAIIALGLHDKPVFMFILQEKTAPYEVVVRQLSDSALTYGRIQNAKAMDIFSKCLTTGHWPSYEAEPKVLDLPHFANMQLEQKIEDGEFELINTIKAQHYYDGCEKEQ